jgi:hypothetical protein
VFTIGACCIIFSMSCTFIVPALVLLTPPIIPENGLPLMGGPDCRQNSCDFAAMA